MVDSLQLYTASVVGALVGLICDRVACASHKFDTIDVVDCFVSALTWPVLPGVLIWRKWRWRRREEPLIPIDATGLSELRSLADRYAEYGGSTDPYKHVELAEQVLAVIDDMEKANCDD